MINQTKTSVKQNMFFWVCGIIGIHEGSIAPGWLTWLFFPIEKFCLRHSPIKFNFMRDSFTIYGIEYSRGLLRAWGEDGLPVGTMFRIVGRQDGRLIIETILDEKHCQEEN